MKSFRLAPVAALLCSICFVHTASATTPSLFDRMYVFGDSLSDGGNAWNLTQYVPGSGTGFPPSPPYAQRLSNGPTAAEQLAGLYGVPSAPSFSGGFNYAVGGAATQTLTVPYNPFPPVPTPPGTIDTSNFIPFNYWYLQPQYNISALTNTGLQSQVDQFASSGSRTFDPNRSLFMVWGGANDFFMFPALAPSAVPGAVLNAASQIGSFVDTLYANGARIFLVPNLPDLAKTPDSADLSDPEKAALTGLTQYFNGALDAQLDARRLAYSDITLIDFDTFAGFNDILDNKAAYGLTNVTTPCLAADLQSACSTPESYLFWDSVHPTERGHQIIADQFYTRIQAAIPEPETYALMAAGLLLMSWQVRRRTVY